MRKYRRIFEALHYFSNLNEAVIHTEKYQEVLEEALFSVFDYPLINKSSDEIIKKLNSVFSSYNILFKIVNEEGRNGIVRGKSIEHSIIIFVTEDFNKYFKDRKFFARFLNTCGLVFAHELVHRGQYLQNVERVHLNKNVSLIPEDLKYYRNKHELMAFANMIIEELRFNGYTNEMILKGLQNNSLNKYGSGFLIFYQETFEDEPQILKLLYKYIYMYLKEPIKIEL